MPDLSDLIPFHSGQVENFIYLSLDKYKCIKLIKKIVFLILISYYEVTCCIENSVDTADQLASSEAS